MKDEYGFMMIKPPSLKRRNVAQRVYKMIEDDGLEIVIFQIIRVSQDQATRLYIEHKDSDFYPWLVEQITSGQAGLFLLKGEDVAQKARNLAFKIRELLKPKGESLELSRREHRAIDNVVHTPDPTKQGVVKREIVIFFPAHYAI